MEHLYDYQIVFFIFLFPLQIFIKFIVKKYEYKCLNCLGYQKGSSTMKRPQQILHEGINPAILLIHIFCVANVLMANQ